MPENITGYEPIDPNDPTDPGGGGYDPGGGGFGGGGGTPNFGTIVMNKPFRKYDTASSLDLVCYLNVYSGDDLQFTVYISIDGTIVQTGAINLVLDNYNSQAQQTMTVTGIVEGIPAGDHTCLVQIRNRETDSDLTVQAGSVIKIYELRQGGR